jgi:hypothetical protein
MEKVWIEMAIAQRSSAKASIEASIRYPYFASALLSSDLAPGSEGNVGLYLASLDLKFDGSRRLLAWPAIGHIPRLQYAKCAGSFATRHCQRVEHA